MHVRHRVYRNRPPSIHVRRLRAAITSSLAVILAGCVVGIPSANEFPKPHPHECKVVVTDGSHVECMSAIEFARWRRRNGL